MNVLALIPARAGSRGIQNKNFKPLAGLSPLDRVRDLCGRLGLRYVVSSDCDLGLVGPSWLRRPSELAQDDTPMIDVVRDALARIPGPEDEMILLLQPTQPLRQPKHLQAAIALLRETQADSVVSVVELPRTHHPDFQCEVVDRSWHDGQRGPWLERVKQYDMYGEIDGPLLQDSLPTRRQAVPPTYIRDGTVYAFWRRNLSGRDFTPSLYGSRVRPLIIDPSETCALDTLADWAEAECRLRKGVDLRALLRKYIDHVECCEGVNFLGNRHRDCFTPDEWDILQSPAYDHDDAEADG